MKRTIKIGIIQQTCTNDIRHNLSKLHRNIEQVAAAGAQLVVLQELHNTSYFCQTEDTDMFDLAEWLLSYSRSVLRDCITIQPSFLTKMAV